MDLLRCRVFKFGGSSLGSAERLVRVLGIILRESRDTPVAVVVSAMGDTTDQLIRAAELAAADDLEQSERVIDTLADRATAQALLTLEQLRREPASTDAAGSGLTAAAAGGAPGTVPAPAGSAAARVVPEVTPLVREHFAPLRKILYGVSLLRELTPQTRDLILSFGELLSARLVSLFVEVCGRVSVFVDARTWVVTDDRFSAAMVDGEESRGRLSALAAGWEGVVPVTTGFIGATRDGRTTTLGRNGSDYTATLMAWALGAAEVDVFTDVPGVMTADPDLVSDAYALPAMSYLEALELANFGASMFHPRTMIPLIQSGIPMRIRSTLRSQESGTLIDGRGNRDESRPTCVTSLENLALLGLQWRALTRPAHVAERVHRALAAEGLTVWMENQAAHGQSVCIVVPARERERSVAVIEAALEGELRRGELEPLQMRCPVTLLTLVGEAMGRTAGVAGRFFSALGAVGVNILASVQGASSRSVSAVIDAADTPVAVRTVHAAFNFSHQQVSVLLLGKGTVGAALLSQIAGQEEFLKREHDVLVKVAGIVSSRGQVFDEGGIAPADWREKLDAPRGAGDAPDVTSLMDRVSRMPVPVLVDCTAAEGMESLYQEAFRRGIHVVAANKKPLTIAWPMRQKLMESARRHHRAYHYETTVGASLPVIETLKNLVRTGDRVRLIEGSFSGTLGYLTNELMAGVSVSAAVRKARDLGYTEPNPQDDLAGLDVARKALILARELGFALELSDIEVEPLVPRELLAPMPVEEFLERLTAFDPAMASRVEDLRRSSQTLRYLARVEPLPATAGCRARVAPVGIPADHPAVRLRGSEAFIAFTTDRYEAYPLIVQGSGAGGAVTAAGVLADVLRVSQDLRGR